MRLLNTTTLKFEDFHGIPEEPYAILSHRWGDEEITYKDLKAFHKVQKQLERMKPYERVVGRSNQYVVSASRRYSTKMRRRAGFRKIVAFCKRARQRGLRLAWVDTCCIDKRSSAELSEAINSMYQWYRSARECYVWLEDCHADDPVSLGRCQWFSRGWTLQELLAPSYVVFFSLDWTLIGHLHSHMDSYNRCCCRTTTLPDAQAGSEEFSSASESGSDFLNAWGPDLTAVISSITAIPANILSKTVHLRTASIAARMSWASQRSTTRPEDRAYSLLGIFNINMPLLYGEGSKAFRRLQEKIIKKSEDTSIFCYNTSRRISGDLLASSPDDFTGCGKVTRGRLGSSKPYSLTNKGLKMTARTQRGWYEGTLATDHPVSSESSQVHVIDLGCVGPNDLHGLPGADKAITGPQYLLLSTHLLGIWSIRCEPRSSLWGTVGASGDATEEQHYIRLALPGASSRRKQW